jgi:fumarate hydratase class II
VNWQTGSGTSAEMEADELAPAARLHEVARWTGVLFLLSFI